MRIGQLSAATGVSAKAIRYYEQIGLLPEPVRTQSGYRNYDERATDRLGFVKASQRAGLTLAEIRTVLEISDEGDAPCGHVSDLIDDKLREIQQRLEALKQTRSELEQLKQRAEHLNPDDCGPDSICHILEPLQGPMGLSSRS